MKTNTTKAKDITKKILQTKRQKVPKIMTLKMYLTGPNVEHVATYKI